MTKILIQLSPSSRLALSFLLNFSQHKSDYVQYFTSSGLQIFPQGQRILPYLPMPASCSVVPVNVHSFSLKAMVLHLCSNFILGIATSCTFLLLHIYYFPFPLPRFYDTYCTCLFLNVTLNSMSLPPLTLLHLLDQTHCHAGCNLPTIGYT